MPVTWPSLSDLARLLGVDLSTFSRLATVRKRATRRIGREVRMAPSEAVDVLVERGLDHEIAETQVRRVVGERRARVPAAQEAEQLPVKARLVASDGVFASAPRLIAVRLPPAPEPSAPTSEERFA
jgi:hypothetical protein